MSLSELVVHVGMGKTGTSSIQHFLRANEEVLAEHGVLYPRSPGGRRHIRLGLFITPDAEFSGSRVARRQRKDPVWRDQILESPAAFRDAFETALVDEVDASGQPRVLLSDEAVFGSSEGSMRLLGDFARRHGADLRLVCYLRRQDDHVASRYQQAVKWGEVRRIAERTAELDLGPRYDYDARLAAWSRVAQPDDLVVRRFERARFHGGSLTRDFLDAAGVVVAPDALDEEVPTLNESLDAESVEFLRILNLHRVRRQGAEVGMINNRKLVRRLASGPAGPTLALPEPVLDQFMARWEDGNRRVARRWFGEDGDLFAAPRKSEGTTPDQRLDPALFDHFFALSELPERLHAPLRRLAEREAATGVTQPRPRSRTRSIAKAGSARTTDFRPVLSVTSEKSRRRLKMIVSGTTRCRQPASSVSIVNWKSWKDSPRGTSRGVYGVVRCASRGARQSES